MQSVSLKSKQASKGLETLKKKRRLYAIAGAGIAGRTAAIGLAENGAVVHLFDPRYCQKSSLNSTFLVPEMSENIKDLSEALWQGIFSPSGEIPQGKVVKAKTLLDIEAHHIQETNFGEGEIIVHSEEFPEKSSVLKEKMNLSSDDSNPQIIYAVGSHPSDEIAQRFGCQTVQGTEKFAATYSIPIDSTIFDKAEQLKAQEIAIRNQDLKTTILSQKDDDRLWIVKNDLPSTALIQDELQQYAQDALQKMASSNENISLYPTIFQTFITLKQDAHLNMKGITDNKHPACFIQTIQMAKRAVSAEGEIAIGDTLETGLSSATSGAEVAVKHALALQKYDKNLANGMDKQRALERLKSELINDSDEWLLKSMPDDNKFAETLERYRYSS